MEGQFMYNFIPDINPKEVNGGRGYFLTSGDFLRIFDESGAILWEGELHLVPSRISALFFPDRHRLKSGVWATTKQKGVSYADWVRWFWTAPRLRGEFFRH